MSVLHFQSLRTAGSWAYDALWLWKCKSRAFKDNCWVSKTRYDLFQRGSRVFLHCFWGFPSVQLLRHVRLFATSWTTARQASLSITSSQNLPKLMSIESVMPSNNLILCHPLQLLPSIFPNIRVFSDESALHIRWPKYWFQLQHQSLQWTPRIDLL